MIYPTIKDLSNEGQYNRYEIALAAAKCARKVTNEYTAQRVTAEQKMTGNKETDKPLYTQIDRELRDEKAVKIAIARIHKGDYQLTHKDPADQEREEQEFLESLRRACDEEYLARIEAEKAASEAAAAEDAADDESLDAEDEDAVEDISDVEDEADAADAADTFDAE